MAVVVADLQAFDPEGAADEVQADIALKAAEALVESYCRGRHVDVHGDSRPGVDTVVLTVAARLVANPGQVVRRDQAGPFSTHRGEGFKGFTLAEQAVLNRYRKQAL